MRGGRLRGLRGDAARLTVGGGGRHLSRLSGLSRSSGEQESYRSGRVLEGGDDKMDRRSVGRLIISIAD